MFIKFYLSYCLGIQLMNQNIPSGIFSALEETNITESLHISYNDVRLRWIANENWTYTLNFQGKIKFIHNIKQNLLIYCVLYKYI